MAKILLNTRASRITIVDGILLLPAEVKDDDRLGKVVSPSKTLISERGSQKNPSMYERIMRDGPTQRLFEARVIEWSNEKADEPEPEDNPEVRPEPVEPPKYRDQHHAEMAATVRAQSEVSAGRSDAASPTGFLPRAEEGQHRSEPNADAARAAAATLPKGVTSEGLASATKHGPAGDTQVGPGATDTQPAPGATGTARDRVHTDEAVDAVAKGSEAHERTGGAKGHHGKGGHGKGG